jgi:hypothetical protein
MVSETASEDFDRSNDFKETGLYRIDSIGKHLDASRSRVPTSDDLLSASNDLRTHSKASLARSFSYKDDQKRSHRLSGADVNDREEAFFNFKGTHREYVYVCMHTYMNTYMVCTHVHKCACVAVYLSVSLLICNNATCLMYRICRFD